LLKSPTDNRVIADEKLTRRQLIERRLLELANGARDLTASILGDPPVGRSALDKKRAKAAQANDGIWKSKVPFSL
jgi:hypothetical protein